MTFKGTVRDGVIVSGDAQHLPEGTQVEISVVKTKRSSRSSPRVRRAKTTTIRKKGMTAEERVAIFMKSFGISKDRPEWKGRTTQDIARELRQRASGTWAQKRKKSRG